MASPKAEKRKADDAFDLITNPTIRAAVSTLASVIEPAAIFAKLPHLSSTKKRIAAEFDLDIASAVDHTVLKPETTAAQVDTLCEEALKHKFAAVCVNGCRAAQALEKLKGSDVKVAVVVGFPLGACTTAGKVAEARELIKLGVAELDMVLNVGLLKDRQYMQAMEDIKAVVDAAVEEDKHAVVKVILETCLLSDEEIAIASILSALAGAHFVKTSTGFGSAGATLPHVQLMKETVADVCRVKASGGVRTRDDALALLRAGASRLGTSGGVKLVEGAAVEKGAY